MSEKQINDLKLLVGGLLIENQSMFGLAYAHGWRPDLETNPEAYSDENRMKAYDEYKERINE